MRYLLAVLLAVPALAQTAPQAAPPQDQPAASAPITASADNPAPASSEDFHGSIDFGYRWLTDVRGDLNQYRSVVNLGQGPKLFGLEFTWRDPGKRFFDQIDIRADGWGGEPYTTAHVDARKQRLYDFSFDYRNIAYFNAVPSFANPGAPGGFDEQSFDIRRRSLAAALDLFPGGHFVPYLAFDHNAGSGRGIDTWVQDANNEYAVPALFSDATENYRGGVRIEYARFHLTLEQGGTTYKDNDQASDATLVTGDNPAPILGQTLSLSSLQQAYGMRGHSIYSKVLFTASPTPWFDVYGQFLYSEPKTEVNFSEVAGGSFLDLSQLLFYSSLVTMGTGTDNQPHTTGNIGFELRPLRRLRIIESLMTDRYHDAAAPAIAVTQSGTTSTGGFALLSESGPTAFTEYVNYNQQQIDALLDVTSRLTLHGAWRYVWGDAQTLAGQLSQTGPLAAGQLKRNTGIGGLTYRALDKLSFHLDFEGATSDDVYFRTSLNNYKKGRARARYQLAKALSLQANFQVLNNQNPAQGINYSFQSRDNALSIFWAPDSGKRISLMGEYDRSTLSSNIDYLTLPFLTSAVSQYRDSAHSATSALNLAIPGLKDGKLTLGGSMFVSSGSRPSRYYQPLARVSLPICKHVYWNAEWQYYGYGESFYLYEGFRTHSFITGIRLTQ